MVTAFGPRSRLARGLSLMVAALTAVASGSGLLVGGLYLDPPEVAAMLRGYDLVNLAVAVPVLGLSLLPGWRASLRALLIRVGTLLYLSYTYATHVFGSVFNDLFLLHVAVFGVSLYAVGFCVASLPVARLTDRLRRRTPIKVVSVILAVLGLTLGGMWIFYSLRFTFTGQEPQESRLVLPLASRHLGYVEDLAFLVPAYLIGAVLLWRRAGWGYLLASTLMISGALHQVGYMVALISQVEADIPGSGFDPFDPFIAALALLGSSIMLYRVALRDDSG